METLSYLDEQRELSSSCHHQISDAVLVRALQVMLLTRHVDERMIILQRQGIISFALTSFWRRVLCC